MARAARTLPIAIGGFLILAVVAVGQTSGKADLSVRDGVYSEAQALRGRTAYDNKCATCHDGGTMGPELWGKEFLARYASKTLRVLYDRIKTTMPEDSPGSLSDAEVLDVIAYQLRTNGFAAGEKAMDNANSLETIRFGQ